MAKKTDSESTMTTTAPASTNSEPTNRLPASDGGQNEGTNKPEVKYGPFPGGFGVSIWRNRANDGRQYRSITISPRRYQDNSGEWKDSGSFRPIDLASLILALQQAQHHMQSTPLSSDANEYTSATPAANGDSADMPF